MGEYRTAQMNQIRGLVAEFGIVVPQGIEKLRRQFNCYPAIMV